MTKKQLLDILNTAKNNNVAINELFISLAAMNLGAEAVREYLDCGVLSKIKQERFDKIFNSDSQQSSIDYDKMWQEFLDIYPKSEGARKLHNNKSACFSKYKSYLASKADIMDAHKRVIDATTKYVKYKDKMTETYESTKDRRYWIEAYPLMQTYINNLDDKIEQYKDVDESDIQSNIGVFGGELS